MKKITFTGRGGELFWLFLQNLVLTILTAGFYTPWAKVRYLRYMASHITYDGEPFAFHGKGLELFVGWLKVFLVVAILSFPYGFAMVRNDYTLMIVFYVLLILALLGLSPLFLHGALRYTFAHVSWRGIRMGYTGSLRELFVLYFSGLFLTLITLGIYGSWFTARVYRYLYSHIHIGNVSFGFSGRGGELFIKNLKGLFLSLLTLGLYLPWYYTDIARYTISHMYLEQDGKLFPMSLSLTGGQVFFFWLSRALLLLVTLGIAFPWVMADWFRLRVEALSLEGDPDTESLTQSPVESTDTTGFAFFDLGDGLLRFVFPL